MQNSPSQTPADNSADTNKHKVSILNGKSTHICVEIFQTNKCNFYRLIQDFECQLETTQIIVPKGFVTNFATSPRILWCLVAPTDIPIASLVHDYLYFVDGYKKYAYTRKEADDIFLQLLLQKHSLWISWLCYLCVRLFGHWYFLGNY